MENITEGLKSHEKVAEPAVINQNKKRDKTVDATLLSETNTVTSQPEDEVKPENNSEGGGSDFKNETKNGIETETPTPENPEIPNGRANNSGKTGSATGEKTNINWEEVDQRIDSYKSTIEGKKCCSIILHIIGIILCLVGIGLITKAIYCDCEDVTQNTYALVLLFGLFVILLVTVVFLSYFMVKANRRYCSALIRLEILVTRMNLKKDETTIISDIDHEFQLIARILESLNEKS